MSEFVRVKQGVYVNMALVARADEAGGGAVVLKMLDSTVATMYFGGDEARRIWAWLEENATVPIIASQDDS
jgi:hypothetical protein